MNTAQTPDTNTSSIFNPFTLFGALASDIYELTASTGNAILDIPEDIQSGWKSGLILDTTDQKAALAEQTVESIVEPTAITTVESTPPTDAQIDSEIQRLQNMKSN